jgi:hypothetical protein
MADNEYAPDWNKLGHPAAGIHVPPTMKHSIGKIPCCQVCAF